jgi:hypothetical protein
LIEGFGSMNSAVRMRTSKHKEGFDLGFRV